MSQRHEGTKMNANSQFFFWCESQPTSRTEHVYQGNSHHRTDSPTAHVPSSSAFVG